MTSHNMVNGMRVSEPLTLIEHLQQLIRELQLTSKKYGTYSTAEATNAGPDPDMLVPKRWLGEALGHAIASSKFRPLIPDERVCEVLGLGKLASKSKVPEDAPEREVNRSENRLFDDLHPKKLYMYVTEYKVPGDEGLIYDADVVDTTTPEEDCIYDCGLAVQWTGKLDVVEELFIDNAVNRHQTMASLAPEMWRR